MTSEIEARAMLASPRRPGTSPRALVRGGYPPHREEDHRDQGGSRGCEIAGVPGGGSRTTWRQGDPGSAPLPRVHACSSGIWTRCTERGVASRRFALAVWLFFTPRAQRLALARRRRRAPAPTHRHRPRRRRGRRPGGRRSTRSPLAARIQVTRTPIGVSASKDEGRRTATAAPCARRPTSLSTAAGCPARAANLWPQAVPQALRRCARYSSQHRAGLDLRRALVARGVGAASDVEAGIHRLAEQPRARRFSKRRLHAGELRRRAGAARRRIGPGARCGRGRRHSVRCAPFNWAASPPCP